MQETLNPFDSASGSDRLQSPGYLLLLVLLVAASAVVTSKMGLVGGLGLLCLLYTSRCV